MTALWASEAADRFWSDAGGPPDGFPRDLRRAVALALPLAVVDLPRLRLTRVGAWLERRGIVLPAVAPDRPLRACLLSRDGYGIVFLDGADPDDERRFSLAHEAAHFMAESALPRAEALGRLGPATLSVLDGRRPATWRERADALLAGAPLELQFHLMERTPDGHFSTAQASAAEHRADALAIELLAPHAVVREHLAPEPSPADAERVLYRDFGLPLLVARAYAAQLVPHFPDNSLLDRLGLRPTRSPDADDRGARGQARARPEPVEGRAGPARGSRASP